MIFFFLQTSYNISISRMLCLLLPLILSPLTLGQESRPDTELLEGAESQNYGYGEEKTSGFRNSLCGYGDIEIWIHGDDTVLK